MRIHHSFLAAARTSACIVLLTTLGLGVSASAQTQPDTGPQPRPEYTPPPAPAARTVPTETTTPAGPAPSVQARRTWLREVARVAQKTPEQCWTICQALHDEGMTACIAPSKADATLTALKAGPGCIEQAQKQYAACTTACPALPKPADVVTP